VLVIVGFVLWIGVGRHL